MKTFRPLQPGDMWISAEDINALAEEVKRLGKVNVSGDATCDNGIGGLHIGVHSHPPAFWAKITYEYGSGWYAWKEQERTNLGTFEDLQYGREDIDGMNPAYEVNGTTGIAVGTYVWLELGYGLPVTGGVVQEWIFRVGGGSTGEGFWARISAPACPGYKFGIVEVEPIAGGMWQDVSGGITSSDAYHVNRQQLVQVGTIVWVRPGAVGEYVFDCPAGWSGEFEVVGRWRCVGGVPEVLPFFIQVWNGQISAQPCHERGLPPCSPCSPLPP